ncbi:transposase [Streptomyces colonosanans]|uniref:transposase n=1 Tax=Streptomyces colonosanans TaxID=1428652 RepID=UPI003183253B
MNARQTEDGYKAAEHGRVFVKVDRSFLSPQVCSACGFRDGPKPLHVRAWMCQNCGSEHDRDHNAARNVLSKGVGSSPPDGRRR